MRQALAVTQMRNLVNVSRDVNAYPLDQKDTENPEGESGSGIETKE